ncbi:MAG: hypothetical protein IT260_24025 [Saprospiraceae bacterium]|nr:hypothetical protein [Saprospiraceae bacterium]
MNQFQQTSFTSRFTSGCLSPVSHNASWLRFFTLGMLIVALGALAQPLHAKVTASIATGNWSAAGTWNNGVPADGDQITISAGHTVTLTANIVFVGAGSTLTVNGTLNMSTFTCRVATTTVAAGGTVIQNSTGGVAVAANLTAITLTLNPASTYSYTGNPIGFTGLHPAAYGHLSYASSSASAGTFDINLNVAGNLTINNSGIGDIRFANTVNRSHTIGGNLLISGGNVVGSGGAGNTALDVNGNFTINTSTSFKACAAGGNTTLNLAGNFVQNGTLTSPGAGTFGVAFDGATNSAVSGLATFTFQNVTLNKTGAAFASLSQHLTISKNLTFLNGKFKIGNFNLTMAAGATISGASNATGFVETTGTGKLIISESNPSATFPIGIGDYTPVSLVPTLNTAAFGARVVDGFSAEMPGCNGFVTDDAVKKMWIVSLEQGNATIQNITLNWNGSNEGSTFSRSVCGVVRYLSGDWETPVPNAATGSDPYQRSRNLSGVNGGTFGVLDLSSLVNLSPPTGNSNSPICVGQTLDLSRTSADVSGAVYQWSKQGGGFNPPAGPNASLNNAQITDAGFYLLTLSKYGCNFTSTGVPVFVNPLPPCTITGPEQVCSNTSGHAYQAPANLATYAWSVAGNGSISGASNGPNVSIDAGASGTYTLTLTTTDANSCSSTCTLLVKVLTRPTGALSGSATICEGECADLLIDVTGESPWSGTLSDGTPFGGSTSPIVVTVCPDETTSYTISTLSDAFCIATANDLSGSATVTIDELTLFELTGSGAYCLGGDGVEVGLSGSETGTSYQLLLNNSASGDPVAGTGSAISFGPQTGAGTYTVVATRISTDCSATMSGSVSVTINPLPTVSLTLGDDEALVSETSVALTGGAPGGGVYSGPGVSGSTINPFLAGVGVHTISYTITDNNACSNTATDQFTVSPEPGLNLLVEVPDSVECKEEFSIDIVAVAGFTDLGTLQFSLGWDLNLFEYVGADPTVIDGSTPLVGLINDTLIYSWLDENASPYGFSLPDDTVLLHLTFKPLAACGTTGHFSIIGKPRVIEASDSGLNVVPVTILNTNELVISDTQAPVFDDGLADISVECSQVPDPAEPVASDNCDDDVDVSYDGQTIDEGNCIGEYTIVRTWTATDDCGNSATTSQVIVVHDTTAPSFTVPSDITIYLDSACEYDSSPEFTGGAGNASDNCTPEQTLMPHWSDETAPFSGNQAIITRTWTLSDDCGNSASAQIQLITVRDTTPPSITCPVDVEVIAGGSNCDYTISGLGFQAFDNCGIADTAWTLSGASTGAGTGSLNGVVLNIGVTVVTWTVTAQNGQTATCSFSVSVAECQGITGKLIWEGDDISGVAQAMVVLSGSASDSDGPTATDGLYSLDGAGATLEITPSKTAPPADPLNGVTVDDALLVRYHVLTTLLITDPYKLLAADVDFNNVINSTDASLIRQAVLGSGTAQQYFIAKPWRFVPTPDPGPGFSGYTPPADPFSAPIPESRILTGVAGAVSGQDFYGIKTGDVDATAIPALHPDNQESLTWLVADQALVAGQTVEAVFTASHFEQLAAYQMGLKFDPAVLQWQSVEALPTGQGLSATEDFGFYQVEQGEIRSVWLKPSGVSLAEGTAAFVLRFKVLHSGGQLSEVLRLSEKILRPQVTTVALQKTGMQLVFTETTGLPASPAEQAGVRLLQNRPNPFTGTTTIGLVLPAAGEGQLRVLDAAGRELWRLNKSWPAGYSEETVRLEQAVASGVLYYELSTPYGLLTRRMVVVAR